MSHSEGLENLFDEQEKEQKREQRKADTLKGKQSAKFIATDANGVDVYEGDPLLIEHDFQTDGAKWEVHERAATLKDLEKIKNNLAWKIPDELQRATTKGKTAEVLTDNRAKYPVKYKVVEADDLNVSHLIDVNGNVVTNKDFPAELQPRDRNRESYRAEV